jgi:hypothetical protein
VKIWRSYGGTDVHIFGFLSLVGLEMLQEKKGRNKKLVPCQTEGHVPIIHIKFTLFKVGSGGLSLVSLTSTQFMSR